MTQTKPAPHRAAGILLHPTSLPGPFGVGDLGPTAYAWIETLVQSKQKWWQILPLGPTGFGDSPYQCFSAFAGNPLLISPQKLADQGWLDLPAIEQSPPFTEGQVDFAAVIPWKMKLLHASAREFFRSASSQDRSRFEAFSAACD